MQRGADKVAESAVGRRGHECIDRRADDERASAVTTV